MQRATIILCTVNILMPMIAAVIVTQGLRDKTPLKMGVYGSVVCSVTSTVLYVNLGLVGYPNWMISLGSTAMIFFFSFVIGFLMGYVMMMFAEQRLKPAE